MAHIKNDIKSFRLSRAVKLSTKLAGTQTQNILGDMNDNPLHTLLLLIAEATVNPSVKDILGAAGILLFSKLGIKERASMLVTSLSHTFEAQPWTCP